MDLTYRIDTSGAERSLLVMRRTLVAGGDALGRGATLIQREAVRRAPKADGTLARQIQRGRLGVAIFEIVSRADHGAYVERGTGIYGPLARRINKGMPDSGVARIAAWIARRGIVARSVRQEDLPYVIARKIARDGTRAQPYMEPAADAMEPRVRQLVRAAIDRSLSVLRA